MPTPPPALSVALSCGHSVGRSRAGTTKQFIKVVARV